MASDDSTAETLPASTFHFSPSIQPITSLPQLNKLLDEEPPQPLVIQFWASYCGPCKAITPLFNTLAAKDEYSNVGFYRIQIDDEEEGARDGVERLAHEFGVRQVPTFVSFSGGMKEEDMAGTNPKKLEDMVRKVSEDGKKG